MGLESSVYVVFLVLLTQNTCVKRGERNLKSTIMAVNLCPCACCRQCLELNFGQKYASAGSIGNHVHLHSRVSVLQTSVGLQILHFDLRAMQLVRSFDRNFLDHFNLKTSPVSLICLASKSSTHELDLGSSHVV